MFTNNEHTNIMNNFNISNNEQGYPPDKPKIVPSTEQFSYKSIPLKAGVVEEKLRQQ